MGLHYWSNPRPEICVANNSGAFFAHASLIEHGPEAHPKLTIFRPKFWLDDVHPDYFDLDWGQSVKGLPRNVRREFMEIYRSQPSDKRITWGQMRNLREYMFDKLEKKGISVIPGIPKIVKHKNGYHVSSENSSFDTPLHTHIYSSFRTPNTNTTHPNLPPIPHILLFIQYPETYSLISWLLWEVVVQLFG